MLTIDLKDRKALVTGVTSGIGQGVTRMLARSGCRVFGCGLESEDSEPVGTFFSILEKEGVKGGYFQADVTREEDLEKFVKQGSKVLDGIDILVSNAGLNVFEGAGECTSEQWDFNMYLNLKSHWRLSHLCKPFLEERANGVIILMTSNHAYATIPGCFPYNVAKTGLKGLVQSLAIEWGPEIRTVGIAPGFIETPGNQKWFESFPDPSKERQDTIDRHPVKRLGSVEDVGALCAFLASDLAQFISGSTYLIDGGRSALMQD